MMILGESYDEYFGLDEYDPYDPCEGYEDDRDRVFKNQKRSDRRVYRGWKMH